MKRILTLLMVLCLVLSLAACTPAQKPAQTETTAQTDAPNTDAPDTDAPETNAPDTNAPGESRIHGTVEGNAYINEALNLRIARPSGWTFFSEEQIAERNNMTLEFLKGTDAEELLAKNGQMIDMMVQDAAGSNANLVIQPNQAGLSAYSDQQVFELSESTYRSQMGTAGMEITEYETQTCTFLGEEKTMLRMVLKVGESELTEYQIWLRDNPDYMAVLTVTLMDETDPQTFLDGITRIN